jgi:hypothetical protein
MSEVVVAARLDCVPKVGDTYRRNEEIHRQQLFEESSIVSVLERIGFKIANRAPLRGV